MERRVSVALTRSGFLTKILLLFYFYFIFCYWITWDNAIAQGISGTVDLSWEDKREDDKRISTFTQIYDVYLQRELMPLYDASAKLQFRSEDTENKRNDKTQFFPALNVNFGNEKIGLSSGWSRYNVDYDYSSESEDDYTTTRDRFSSTFKLNPSKLPNILLMYWKEDVDSDNSGVDETKDQLAFKEDYSLNLGMFRIYHSYETRRENDYKDDISNTYDLSNKVAFAHNFSVDPKRIKGLSKYAEKLMIGTRYEFGFEREKDEYFKRNRKLDHNGKLNIDVEHNQQMDSKYNFNFSKTNESDNGSNIESLGNDLIFRYRHSEFLTTEIGGAFNRYTSYNNLSWLEREKTNYSFKLEPDIIGLFFNSDRYHVYPVHSYLLINRSSEETYDQTNKEKEKSREWSVLLNTKTTLYRGVNISGEVASNRIKYHADGSTILETRFDLFLDLKLKPGLSGSIKHKTKWERDTGGDKEGREFTGKLETDITYRPIETFMIGFGTTINYSNEQSGYDFRINWNPKDRKFQINMIFESRYEDYKDEEEKERFFGEVSYNFSPSIQLRFQYRYPSDEQRQLVRFIMRF